MGALPLPQYGTRLNTGICGVGLDIYLLFATSKYIISLRVQYNLNCVESAIKPQPTNCYHQRFAAAIFCKHLILKYILPYLHPNIWCGYY